MASTKSSPSTTWPPPDSRLSPANLMTFTYTHLGPKEVDFVPVAAEDELPNGERIFVQVDDYSIVLFNIAGQYFAIGDICSHDNGPVGEGELEEFQIICPRHGARFDRHSGLSGARCGWPNRSRSAHSLASRVL
jgi:nitrite reductase/ring-hydroxylating ferredoxin subunit